jgi:hypothetical protein
MTEAEVRFLLDKFAIMYDIHAIGFTAHLGPVEPISVVLLHMASQHDAQQFIEYNGRSGDYATRYYTLDNGAHVIAVLL